MARRAGGVHPTAAETARASQSLVGRDNITSGEFVAAIRSSHRALGRSKAVGRVLLSVGFLSWNRPLACQVSESAKITLF